MAHREEELGRTCFWRDWSETALPQAQLPFLDNGFMLCFTYLEEAGLVKQMGLAGGCRNFSLSTFPHPIPCHTDWIPQEWGKRSAVAQPCSLFYWRKWMLPLASSYCFGLPFVWGFVSLFSLHSNLPPQTLWKDQISLNSWLISFISLFSWLWVNSLVEFEG